jgi:transketolase
MDEIKLEELNSLAYKVRQHVIRMSGNGGCFIGASLSCTDLLVYLYLEFLNVTKDNLQDPNRDYLFLSKGHDVPALYGTLAELGFFERDRLLNHLSTNDNIYWHPNTSIPGIEFHSGSLGHLLSVAMGVAYDCKIKKQNNKIVVILGDGELNEGTIWEGLLVAASIQLGNMMIVVDRNHFQANMRTEDLIKLEPIQDKFKAFGCDVIRIDGHDFNAMNDAFNSFPFSENKISVVIADTVRGKGLPSIEARADRWFCNFKDNEVLDLLIELDGNVQAQLESEVLIVR